MQSKHKILYIDDEIINLDLFEHHFSDNYNVITSITPSGGLNALEKDNDIKLVVSDMCMPIMDGLEFITKAKEIHPNTIFLILTGYSITDKIRDALNSNLIKRYFCKPLDFLEMEKYMQSIID